MRMRCALFLVVMLLCAVALPVAAADTTPPVINSVTITPNLAAAGDTVHVVANVSDDTGVTSVTCGSVTFSLSGGNYIADIPVDPILGAHNITITARDAAGNTATDSSGQYLMSSIIGISGRAALDPIIWDACQNYLFRIWGKAAYVDANTFTLSDGSPTPITVLANGHCVASDETVIARGIIDNSTAPPSLLRYPQYTIIKTVPRTPITVSDISVGKDLQTSHSGYLPSAVPTGKTLNIMITSTDPSRVLLSKTINGAGSGSITITVGSGSSVIPTFYVHGLDSSGSVDVIATTQANVIPNTPSGLGKTFKVNLTPSGFMIYTSSFSTTTVAANTDVQIRPVRLTSGLVVAEYQSVRAGIAPVNVTVSSSNTNVGTITTSPLVFTGNTASMNTQFDPVGAGASTISVTQPPGFSIPTQYQSITATVTKPNITAYDTTVGADLQVSTTCALGAVPASPVDVTLTVSSGSTATISKSASVEGTVNPDGTSSITFNSVGSTGNQTHYVQGRTVGTTTITMSATGYNDVTKTIKVDPSGFVIYSPGSINTTTLSSNTDVMIKSARLNPTTSAIVSYEVLRAGKSGVEAPVASSNTSVGTITVSPLVFNAGGGLLTTQFHPVGAGSSTISITQPAGFTLPSTNQSIAANVTSPNITASDVTVGKDLQVSSSCNLSLAPPSAVSVTATISSPSIATISKDANTVGGGSVTFDNVVSTAGLTYYIQGIGVGTTTLIIDASGYNTAVKTIKVDPSGFAIVTTNITTTTVSTNTNVQIRSARLSPSTGNVVSYEPLRAGMPSVGVDVTSTNPSAAAITTSPVVFDAGISTATTQVDPIDMGACTVSITTPAGFSTPNNLQSVTVTVNKPNISASDQTVGKDLQVSTSCSLGAVPDVAKDVTVTVTDSAIATITKDSSTEGSGSITFTGVTTTGALTFHVQGRSEGSATFTVTADGYNSVTRTITVHPSGFVIYIPGNFSTNVGYPNTTIQIRPARLNPTTLNYVTYGTLRGGLAPVDVSVTSSNTGVGTIVNSPVTFLPNTVSMSVSFHPVAVGTTTIAVQQPIGFTVPNNYAQITATVN